MASDMASQKANIITKHILHHLSHHAGKRPLIVGVQGPQGSGKTTITSRVKIMLEEQGQRTAVLSIDDLYLPHAGLEALQQDNPTNTLLHGRGQPGTHDMQLGTRILSQLRHSPDNTTIQLPIFDKSQYNGQGDRSKDTVDVSTPLDVVIFEGWCLGFYPIAADELSERYKEATSTPSSTTEKPFFARHSLSSLQEINRLLVDYLDWYKHIDAFVLLRPDSLRNVFAWRLQAEQAMKASGKPGMTDEQVHDFVARYMPGYELFGDGPTRDDTPWAGKLLAIDLDIERNLVGSSSSSSTLAQ